MIRWEPEEEQAADLAQIDREKLRRVLRAALGREPTGEELERALREWEG
jgi:hypothetical protein